MPVGLAIVRIVLNALVYQAYGLDADDIQVIEGYLGEKQHDRDSSMEEVDDQ